jgi:hypothetical protein
VLCNAQPLKSLSALGYLGLAASALPLHSHRHGLFTLIYQRLARRSPCVMCGSIFRHPEAVSCPNPYLSGPLMLGVGNGAPVHAFGDMDFAKAVLGRDNGRIQPKGVVGSGNGRIALR